MAQPQIKSPDTQFMQSCVLIGKSCLYSTCHWNEWGSGTKYSPGRRHNRCDLNKKRMRQKNQEVANINLSDFWIYTHLSYKKYNGNSVINNIN